jgi:hypothetical protein
MPLRIFSLRAVTGANLRAGQAAGVIFFGGNISSEAQIASVTALRNGLH